ncbi:MAG TPA: flagellar basal body rod protein FlgC [Candidatus Angelobacter sp.]|nr:flagellar basal body rod protein FlgC [Candidatus Angelobacter sp.]
MDLFSVLDMSGRALTAQRQRAEVVTANMANAETTRTPEGGPYVRKHVLFQADAPGTFGASLHDAIDRDVRGVHVSAVVPDSTPAIKRFDPGHPDADANGYVSFPAINPVEEMVDLMGAVRSYQLNTAAVQATKSMIQQSLEILK